ncbi:RDD family protein [Amycolatopsis panacis]|uniref:RDD family protein n=1 Tax=Amycolatopsis panacis TaxID=2340917 RepID=A0A419I684_9PSEU|nr:RDD family protein [Amycolatopsis panacis]RJQ86666.1 RDD family protein [Amycolatopsis panacis]
MTDPYSQPAGPPQGPPPFGVPPGQPPGVPPAPGGFPVPQGGFGQPQPGFGSPQGAHGGFGQPHAPSPQPGFGAPQPGYGQPGFGGPNPYGPPGGYANWGLRVLAMLIDYGPLLALHLTAIIVGTIGLGSIVTTICYLLAGLGSIGWGLYTRWLRGGTTGQSLGKRVVGIKLVSEVTGQPIGPGMAFVRDLTHVFDGFFCFVGFLWPLWDERAQTFADKIIRTVVLPADAPAPPQAFGYGSPQAGFGPPPGFGQHPSGGFAQPQAAFGQQPGFGQPGQPQPGFGQSPAEGLAQPQPGLAQPQAGFGQPQAGFGQPQPSVGQPGQPQPGFGQQPPGLGQPGQPQAFGQLPSGGFAPPPLPGQPVADQSAAGLVVAGQSSTGQPTAGPLSPGPTPFEQAEPTQVVRPGGADSADRTQMLKPGDPAPEATQTLKPDAAVKSDPPA